MPAGLTADALMAGPDPVALEPGRARRSSSLALARLHLRLGSLALARAELEILAGEGALDGLGQVDLAEARWRSGDLAAAGLAATAALEAGADGAMVLAIAAEAAAALGRPNEARRLATRALEHVGGPVDSLFAGMPRSGVWPSDADEPPPTAGTLFHHEPPSTISLRAGDTDPGVVASRASAGNGRMAAAAAETALPDTAGSPGAPGAPAGPGFWDADAGDGATQADLPDPALELDAGRAALLAGSIDEAVLRMGLALRLAPALAPAILEATDGVAGPSINVIRGDAYRQVGLETEAKRAYAAAAWSGSRDRRNRSDPPPASAATPDKRPTPRASPPLTDDPAPPDA